MNRAILILAVSLLPMTAFAQFRNADISALLGSPQGAFRDNLDATAVGINGSIAYAIPESPVHIGAELGIMVYGEDRRAENFNPNIPEVRVNVVTSYDIFTGHAFLRLEPLNGVVRPYVDGLVGLNYLFAQTDIRDRDGQFDTIASETNFDDTALSYGLGGGLKFRVHSTSGRQTFINLKARYLFGSEADYLQPGSIKINDGVLTFDESTSETDLFTLHLGVAFKF